MATSSPSPSTSAPQQKKAPILPSGCRAILWALVLLITLVALSIYKRSHQYDGVRKKEAMIMAVYIANSVEQFYADYNALPLSTTHSPPLFNDTDTDSSSAQPTITILIGREEESSTLQNPRKTDFVEGIKPAKKASPKQAPLSWINGIYPNETTGPYGVVDAWGNHYKIRLDTNNDQQLLNPNPEQVKDGRSTLAKRVLVWSAGRDGDWDTWDDNPMSWD